MCKAEKFLDEKKSNLDGSYSLTYYLQNAENKQHIKPLRQCEGVSCLV